jgi:hypothetical protein
MPNNIDPQAVRRLAAQLRGLEVTEARAAQLAVEIARVNEAARAEGAKNDLNDQPTSFAVTLAALAKR